MHRDSAISEIAGTVLILALLAILVMVVAALLFGTPLLPKKPVLATFEASKVLGADTSSSHRLTIPVIVLYQTAGDTLTQEYTAGTHGGINGTKISVISPDGKMYTVVQSVTLTKKTIRKGDPYYIFRRQIGEPNEYWITADPSRIFSPSWGGVDPFKPHGKWQLVVTDEKDTNMVIFRDEILL